jgi:diguanylate cyclase (GGDEF)-like protein/PAS domain S-box-containing protein
MTDRANPMRAVPSYGMLDDEGALRALNETQFVPYFQPLVTLRTGQLAGFEVLARWQHPSQGLIPPSRFIRIAEQGGWIDALTEQILVEAFAAASTFPDTLTLSINLSPVQLRDFGLPQRMLSLATEAGFPLSRLIVEITESALIEDPESAAKIVGDLKQMGCRLALDDFGTGYSSLHHLQSLPFDELKVDRSFVSSMTEKRDSRKIVAAVVGLGQSLGLTTVAEGIETQEQAEMMLWLGCELGQGYFYGRPMPAEDLGESIAISREALVSADLSAWKRISASDLNVSPSQRLAQLQAVYDGAPVGLAFIDQNLRYVNLNKKLADMNGAPVDKHLGSKVSEMAPELFPYVEPYIRRALDGEAVLDVEATIPNTGETRLLSYQPALDEAGEVVGVAIAVTDITERKRTEDALKASEDHYRSMVELNPQVLWIMDPQGRNLDVTPRWDRVTGMMQVPSTEHDWLRSIHPDDFQATVHAIAKSRRGGSPIDVEYRVENADGGWRWKRSMGAPRFDSHGNIVCWYGSVQDVQGPRDAAKEKPSRRGEGLDLKTTIEVVDISSRSMEGQRRHQAIVELEILDTPAEAEFDDLVILAAEISATPIGVISLLDSERQWFKASIGTAVCEIPNTFSFCAHAIAKKGLFVVEDASKDELFKSNPLVLGDPHIRFYAGMPLYVGDGIAVGALCVIDTVPRSLSPRQVKALAILSQQVQARMELRSERRKLLRAVGANRELTAELKKSNETLRVANVALERLAGTDSMTGLLNRRAFEDKMSAEFSSALRRQRSLSILVMDIDDFKIRNDQYGHAAGDAALRHVGEVLRKVVRSGDCAARTGGEEFAIILPETSADQSILVAQRVQELLGSTDPDDHRVSLSIGIASLQTATTDWETLFSQADHAMYQAKQTGKNQFLTYTTRNVPRSPGDSDT